MSPINTKIGGPALGKKDRRRRADASASTVDYWHGGFHGLGVGDVLMPGTTVPGYRDIISLAPDTWTAEYRPDFVYITTNRDLALDYAIRHARLGALLGDDQSSNHGLGALYKVRPSKGVWHDPDYPPGVSFRCTSAKIISIEAKEISDATPLTGAAAGYETWDDKSPMHNKDGYALPSNAQRALGVTALDLRFLGPYPDSNRVRATIDSLIAQRHPGITQAEVNGVRLATGGGIS